MNPRFLTEQEVAAEARVSRSTVRHWIRVGRLVRTKLGKRSVISREAFEAMIRAGSKPPPDVTSPTVEPGDGGASVHHPPQAPTFDARRAVELLEAERKMQLADELLRRAIELLTELVGDEPELTIETQDKVIPELQMARRALRRVVGLLDPKTPQIDPPKRPSKTTPRKA